MDKIWAFIMAVVFGVLLTMVAGFVVSSINGYPYNFASAVPIGALLGIIIFIFGRAVTAKSS